MIINARIASAAILVFMVAVIGRPVSAQERDAAKDPVDRERPAPVLEQEKKSTQPDSRDGGKSVSVSIGVSASALEWIPVWGRVSQVNDMTGVYTVFRWVKLEKMSREFPIQPGGIGGLQVMLSLPRGWGLSIDARAGAYRTASITTYASLNNGPDYTRFTVETTVFDADLRAEYTVNPWFTIFAGPRYQGYRYQERHIGGIYAVHESRSTTFNALGLTVGGAFTVKLVKNLSLVPAIAFSTMYGLTTGTLYGEALRHSIALGGDVTLPLAYEFRKIGITVGLGYTYQFLYYIETIRADYLNRWDHRDGLTASVSYTF